MRIPLDCFTQEIREEYNILDIADHRYVCNEIRKGVYGLKEAEILVFNYIIKNLIPFEYYPVKCMPNLWKYISRPTTFNLCVDGIGIKYHTKNDQDYLINALTLK